MAVLYFLALLFSFYIGFCLVAADPDNIIDTQDWINLQIANVDGFFPTPWLCPGSPPSPQSMLQFHYNWHCTNPDASSTIANWGDRFFGFHKQFILGYNNFLASRNEKNVQSWYPYPGAPIPPEHRGRASNTPCVSCEALLDTYKVPAAGGTLNNFATIDALGRDIVWWHNNNHGFIAAAGGTGDCPGPDMGCKDHSPNDPIFYRYHHIFDDVQDAWATYQPTDIAIVLDRSGSMSLPITGGGDRLDAAKTAAELFANLLEPGSSHKLGMVSFSTTASNPPDMQLTNVAGAPAALSAALAGIVASGSTSIGDGLEKAQTLISGGSEQRKAILLLTDGMENTAPFISDAESAIANTHVCSIGLGTPGTLDGPRLQDLSQRQGGIYMSTTTALELKKFFVFCFANLFETFAGEDPIDTLPAGQLVSAPTVHSAFQDDKIVFVLGWTHSLPQGTLQLAITTPSGVLVDLSSASVESKFGSTWQIVRIKLPYNGEQDGNWTARVTRPVFGYVNGFSSRSFDNFDQGVALVRNELANLCAYGCRNILYYEDPANFTSFVDSNSIYADALSRESGQKAIGTITRPANASEFARVLQNGFGEGGFDLLVYSSQFTATDQPYDKILAKVLCSNITSNIISDNRHTQGAQDILRCAGAIRGKVTNFTTLTATNSLLLDRPAKLRAASKVLDFSYELLLTNGTEVQATSGNNSIGVLAQGQPGQDEEFFITVLTSSTAKVKPFTFQNNTYTLEPLHPTFHIPESYWPSCGFDNVTAFVNITRPLKSLSQLLASVGTTTGSTIQGDNLTPRQAAGQNLTAKNTPIPTESEIFPLYDDGTHGDSTANDHYWEASLPANFTAIDGDYQMHAFFRLCKRDCCGGPDKCIAREAQQAITIRALLCANRTTIKVTAIPGYSTDRVKSQILITPADCDGTLLGPGLANELIILAVGNVKIESVADEDGKGTYVVVVDWAKGGSPAPAVTVAQFGRPGNNITVSL